MLALKKKKTMMPQYLESPLMMRSSQIGLVISMQHYTLVYFVEVVGLHSRVHILDFSMTVDVPFF